MFAFMILCWFVSGILAGIIWINALHRPVNQLTMFAMDTISLILCLVGNYFLPDLTGLRIFPPIESIHLGYWLGWLAVQIFGWSIVIYINEYRERAR